MHIIHTYGMTVQRNSVCVRVRKAWNSSMNWRCDRVGRGCKWGGGGYSNASFCSHVFKKLFIFIFIPHFILMSVFTVLQSRFLFYTKLLTKVGKDSSSWVWMAMHIHLTQKRPVIHPLSRLWLVLNNFRFLWLLQ